MFYSSHWLEGLGITWYNNNIWQAYMPNVIVNSFAYLSQSYFEKYEDEITFFWGGGRGAVTVTLLLPKVFFLFLVLILLKTTLHCELEQNSYGSWDPEDRGGPRSRIH